MPLARFADLDAPVDDARGKALAPAVDHRGALGGGAVAGKDHAVRHGQAARRIGPGLGVDDAGVADMPGRHGRRGCAPLWQGLKGISHRGVSGLPPSKAGS